jgi:hypothetical protein
LRLKTYQCLTAADQLSYSDIVHALRSCMNEDGRKQKFYRIMYRNKKQKLLPVQTSFPQHTDFGWRRFSEAYFEVFIAKDKKEIGVVII